MNKIPTKENMRQRWEATSKIILVDLDGTITYKSTYPEFGKINPDAVKTLRSWRAAEAEIIINTARISEFWNSLTGFDDNGKGIYLCPDYRIGDTIIRIADWLYDNKIPYDNIWDGEGKCPCLFEVDDKVLGCPKLLDGTLDWHKIWRMGLRKLRKCQWTDGKIQRFERYNTLYEGSWYFRQERLPDEYFREKKEVESYLAWDKEEDQYDKEELEVF